MIYSKFKYYLLVAIFFFCSNNSIAQELSVIKLAENFSELFVEQIDGEISSYSDLSDQADLSVPYYGHHSYSILISEDFNFADLKNKTYDIVNRYNDIEISIDWQRTNRRFSNLELKSYNRKIWVTYSHDNHFVLLSIHLNHEDYLYK